jgi:hypothetical protein
MQHKKNHWLFQQDIGCKGTCSEKEALPILEALRKWRHYLIGNMLIIKLN